MERKMTIFLSTLFFVALFSLQVLAGTYTIEPGTYYQTSMIQSGTYMETTQYGEDKGNYLTISNGLNSITTFAWYKTNYYYDDFPHQVMSGTITKNADGSYAVINDTDATGNDPVESCIESITPISDSEILVYSWGEGDGRWDDYYTMRRVNESKSQSNSVTLSGVDNTSSGLYDPLLTKVGNVYAYFRDNETEQLTIKSDDNGHLRLFSSYKYNGVSGTEEYILERYPGWDDVGVYGYKIIDNTKSGITYNETTDTIERFWKDYSEIYTRYK